VSIREQPDNTHVAVCDGCGEAGPPQVSALNAVVWITAAGWTFEPDDGPRHLCCACAALTRPAGWPRAVLENPADNDARLILADVLTESGKPAQVARGELIRVGVELARTKPHLSGSVSQWDGRPIGGPIANPAHVALTARVEAILKKWGARFLPRGMRKLEPILPYVTGTRMTVGLLREVTFDRGFVGLVRREVLAADFGQGVTVPPVIFARVGDELRDLLEGNPLAEARVSVEGCTPEVVIRVERDEVGTWLLVAHRLGERWGELGVASSPVRAAIVRAVPAGVAQAFAEVEFVRLPGPQEYHDPDDEDPMGEPSDTGDDFAY
jgi:uncharacterized protein (TIGR02996 family)